jgi:hypothetical protein
MTSTSLITGIGLVRYYSNARAKLRGSHPEFCNPLFISIINHKMLAGPKKRLALANPNLPILAK